MDTEKATMKIDGILYVIEGEHTPESCERDGLPNLAAHMREHRQARQLFLRRPKGRRMFFAVQSVNGGTSSATALVGF